MTQLLADKVRALRQDIADYTVDTPTGCLKVNPAMMRHYVETLDEVLSVLAQPATKKKPKDDEDVKSKFMSGR